ncbi:MAG: hypothetical protein KJ737_22685 [Proteobacteria bacterium]|nr:hypothetical protein [Pseudomonadota bacterium]
MKNDNKNLIKYPEVDEAKGNSKFELLVDYLTGLKEEKFTGYIKINFSQGNIGRAEKFEEILKHK